VEFGCALLSDFRAQIKRDHLYFFKQFQWLEK